jgi:hypothetical protein
MPTFTYVLLPTSMLAVLLTVLLLMLGVAP